MLGFGGLAIDMSYFYVARNQLQISADAGATFFEDLVRGEGEALRTPDSADLPELFASLCAKLPLRLVQ